MREIIKKILCFLLTTSVLLYIMAETSYLNNKHLFFDKMSVPALLFGSLSIYLLLLSLPTRAKTGFLKYLVPAIYVIGTVFLLFIILTEASIVNFSGKGFGIEVAYHLEWESFLLGLKEYALAIIIFIIFIVFVIKCHFAINRSLPTKLKWLILLAASVLLFFYFSDTILGRIYHGWKEYKQAQSIPLSSIQDVNQFNHLNIKASELLKDDIQAQSGNNKNVIVLYLESFSDLFTTSKQHPDLTPNLNALKTQYSHLENYYASAGFTMDGLISSNCGFIPNMANGNNSMVLGIRPYSLMPCATDVLKKAGYYQEFIGGAKKKFAGKEAFLLDHGFNKVWGWEDFKEQSPFKDKHSWWGLHDEDLFSLALKKVEELQNKQPFNLTLLTLSTHLKGFASPTCKKYHDGKDKYLNAIYCTDQLVGQFISQLKAKGYLKNTIVFITGDHGVFDTAVVHNLFKGKIDLSKLLGIIIDEDLKNNLSQPLSSYDLGAILLDLLKIKHNATFVYATGLQKIKDKAIFARKKIFQNGAWQPLDRNCKNKEMHYHYPLNACELNKIIYTVYGFTKSFGMLQGIQYNKDSKLLIEFNANETKINDIALKGQSLLNKVRRNGFILEPKLLTRKGVFLIIFNTEQHYILNPFSFDTESKDLGRIQRILNKYKNQPYLIFSNKHKESIKFMSELKNKLSLSCQQDNFCFSNNFAYDELIIEKIKQTKPIKKK